MKVYDESLTIEELTSLIRGKTIDFLESEDYEFYIKINGEEFGKNFNSDDINNLIKILQKLKSEVKK